MGVFLSRPDPEAGRKKPPPPWDPWEVRVTPSDLHRHVPNCLVALMALMMMTVLLSSITGCQFL